MGTVPSAMELVILNVEVLEAKTLSLSFPHFAYTLLDTRYTVGTK